MVFSYRWVGEAMHVKTLAAVEIILYSGATRNGNKENSFTTVCHVILPGNVPVICKVRSRRQGGRGSKLFKIPDRGGSVNTRFLSTDCQRGLGGSPLHILSNMHTLLAPIKFYDLSPAIKS